MRELNIKIGKKKSKDYNKCLTVLIIFLFRNIVLKMKNEKFKKKKN